MKGKRGAATVAGIVLGAMLCGPALAWDAMNTLSTPIEDPLLTRPPVLDIGTVLPGDSAPAPCSDMDVEGSPLSLTEAVDVALCHNPQVQSAWAAIKVQAAALGESRAAYLPTVTLSASRMDDRTWYPNYPAPSTNVQAGTLYGTLSWRLFDFGARKENSRAATALLDAALANHDAVLQKTLAGVIQAYFDAQTTQAAWAARQTNEALARQTLAAAQRRESRGAGAQTDTLQAATALAKATLDQSRAQGAYQKALSVLVYALGVPAQTRLSLTEDLVDPSDGLRQDLDAWLEQAQAQHPAIVAARAQLAAAQAKVVATQAEGLPTIDLTGSYYQNGRPNQSLATINTRETLVGVTLTIPLFEGFARTYKVRGAQAQVEQREADLQDTESQLLMELVKTHADALAALDNLQASQRLLQAAQAALQSVQRKFDKGAADILDILSTQAALSDAQQERIRDLAEWRSARLRLLADAGMLGHQGLGP